MTSFVTDSVIIIVLNKLKARNYKHCMEMYITKLHMSSDLMLILIYVELKLQNIILGFQKNHVQPTRESRNTQCILQISYNYTLLPLFMKLSCFVSCPHFFIQLAYTLILFDQFRFLAFFSNQIRKNICLTIMFSW